MPTKTEFTAAPAECERTTIAKIAAGDFMSFEDTRKRTVRLVRVDAIEKRNAARKGHRAVPEYAYTLADGRTGRSGPSTAVWSAKPAAKATKPKATPAAVRANGGATRKAKAVTPEALVDAGTRVNDLRAELAEATAERNRLMAAAKAGGMRVADITRAAGFASAGAAQNAIASGEQAG